MFILFAVSTIESAAWKKVENSESDLFGFPEVFSPPTPPSSLGAILDYLDCEFCPR
jgi:hypothetical protein